MLSNKNCCFYVVLIISFIALLVIVYNDDKKEESKYVHGLKCKEKSGYKKMLIKSRDGAINGFILGCISGGPIGGLSKAVTLGLISPIVGGISHLKDDDDNLVKK